MKVTRKVPGQGATSPGKGHMLLRALLHPVKYKPFFGASLRKFNSEVHSSIHDLPKINAEELTDQSVPFTLMNCSTHAGNMPVHESAFLASLIASRKPKHLLELGTCDGNTTLQMALNTSDDAKVHTLDLPSEALGYIPYDSPRRRYENTPVEEKIMQHIGDSTEIDFSQFSKHGPIDFIFIDANHDYEFVKNDTLKSLKILSENGVILWHDYRIDVPGVFKWLNEFSNELPLAHIKGTTFAIYVKNQDRSE